MHPHNALLTQKLVDYTNATLETTFQSFENDLQQVEHFHLPLTISKEQIREDQVVKDGKLASLRKETYMFFKCVAIKVFINGSTCICVQSFFIEMLYSMLYTCLRCVCRIWSA